MLLMLPSTWSSLFLASQLPLLILFPLYQILREELFLCQKCVNYLSRFMTFLDNVSYYHLFSRYHHEVWPPKFPFHNSLKDIIPPTEACLYGHINWPLAQAQQVFHGLFSVFPPMTGGKAKPRSGVHFNVKKRPMPESSGASD